MGLKSIVTKASVFITWLTLCQLMFLHSMSDTQDAAKDEKLKSILVEERYVMIVFKAIANKGINKLLGKDYLPVLTRISSRFTTHAMVSYQKS